MTNQTSSNAGLKPKYSHFLGCVMPTKMPWAESAIMKTLPKLGVDLEYLTKSTCCPRAGVWISVDKRVWLTLASYNLLQAEEAGRDVLVSCNGCYVTLYEANKVLNEDREALAMVNGYLAAAGKHFDANIRVRHLLEVLYEDVGIGRIRREARKLHIRVAIHPGCHMRIFQDGHLVRYFSELAEALVDEVVPYGLERMCCGLQANLADREFATYDRAKRKFDAIKAQNVDALVLVCSGCYDQFERAATTLRKKDGYDFDVPVIHLAELLAVSYGLKPDDFGMRYMRTAPVDRLIEKLEKA
ncbi:CoB--CoM heterodisulfide reductase iron-sulfur subunit B family protein [Methanocella conradii]|uniref:CoB--CoM heterodisulfide reductase iron-sulfur subunit B family protein n=1 Tax=Methanocella conradii TaxID=1175444 RepID=UPI0024B397DB|nr:heterodisulfide reductase-related iron-sulfur binding cluster [Methanocella conradii]MDI6897751.1 heterodisulfide reductase-related iron-sulfur binding cluster [Methanocella conradii]